MKTRTTIWRPAGALAGLVAAVGAFSALAAPAGAATVPTATLVDGTVTAVGTAARDLIGITVDSDQLAVDFGQNGTVDARFSMSQVQRLRVAAGAGDDGFTVRGTGVGDVPITVNGGRGNDGGGVIGNIGDSGAGDARVTINGNEDNDNLIVAVPGPATVVGGAGDDRVDGGGAGIGRETISLGDGDDRFVSSLNAFVGARSDVVDGGTGNDRMQVDGTFASESLSLSAKAQHVLVEHEARDRIDAIRVEDVSWFGFGGLDSGSGDAIKLNDLSGTDVTRFTPSFSAPGSTTTPNNSADQLTLVGTALDDHLTVNGSGANITVAGLTPTVTPVLLDSKDVLRIDTLDGNDTVDTSGLQRGLVQLQVF